MINVWTRLSMVVACLLILAVPAFAADRYFLSVGTSWNDTGNWSTNSGTDPGASVPGPADVAHFDENSTNCTLDLTVNVEGILLTNYTGTVTQEVAVAVTNYFQGSGTFAGGANDIDCGTFSVTGGVFTSTSGTLKMEWNLGGAVTQVRFLFSGGTFNHNNGTVKFRITQLVFGTGTGQYQIDSALTLNNLIYAGGGSAETSRKVKHTITGTVAKITVEGDFTQGTDYGSADGEMYADGGTIEVKGDINQTDGASSSRSFGGSTEIKFIGTTAKEYTYTYGLLPDLKIGGTGSLTPASGTTNFGVRTFALTNGTFTAPSGEFLLYRSAWDTVTYVIFLFSGGTFNHNNGTMKFQPIQTGSAKTYTAQYQVDSALTLNHVLFTGGGDGYNRKLWHTITGSEGVISIDGNLTIMPNVDGDASLAYMKLDGGTLKLEGDLTVDENGLCPIRSGTTAIDFVGSGTQTVTQVSGAMPGGTWEVDKTAGSVVMASDVTLELAGQDLILTNGTLNLTNYTLNVQDELQCTTNPAENTVFALSILDTNDFGYASVTGAVSGLANAGLQIYVEESLKSTMPSSQTFDIITGGSIAGEFQLPIVFSGNWEADLIYSATSVTLSNVHWAGGGGTVFFFR